MATMAVPLSDGNVGDSLKRWQRRLKCSFTSAFLKAAAKLWLRCCDLDKGHLAMRGIVEKSK